MDHILTPIASYIERFEERFASALSSDVSRVQEMSFHIQKNRGKRMRPALALLSAQALGGCSDRVIDAAVGIELIQTATLIHDDVIDSAETRRGAEVLNLLWGTQAAVLMGDFLLVRALEILVGLDSMDVMRAATRATRWMIEGELLESESGADGRDSVYFMMIDKKTASLMALACEIGGILGSGSPEQIRQLAAYGKDIGIVFQITDDMLDFIGDEETLGKPVGNDIREGKLTLPLIRAMDSCTNGEAKEIQQKIRRGVQSDEDLKEVVHFVERYQGIEQAREEARTYAQSAIRNLEGLSDSDARNALEQAVHYVAERRG
jgi:octaprenyl-diphosphate synthase